MNDLQNIVSEESETSALIKKIKWEDTLLGPVDAWPQSLKTSLSMCLACRFPILLWWGPELVMLYNDDYMTILGDKHPAAMGGVGRTVWSDIWPVVGPMLEQVRSTGKATKSEDLLLIMNRHGYDEETYFSFSYSPIMDETGNVGGIFTPVMETTEKVITPRRFNTLRLLASQQRAKTLHNACQTIADAMRSNPYDVPFGLIYIFDDAYEEACLAASFGVGDFPELARSTINLNASNLAWPLADVIASGAAHLVSDLATRFEQVPTGHWGVPVQEVVLTPVILAGHERPIAVLIAAVSPHRALDDAYYSFYGLLSDALESAITDALAYDEARKRVEALAEIDRAKTAFFSNVSHEFRTPLTLMLGPVNDMLAGNQLATDMREELLLVRRNATRLLKLVNALLDFSRIEAGRMEIHFEPVDLAHYTAELAGMFRSAIEKAGMELEVDCAPLDEPVYVDRSMWEKIVLNLLSNAFKFTFEGKITVAVKREGDMVNLTVSDTGIGIRPEEIPRFFERFHRIDGAKARTHEGSGIGLALVHDLTKLHNGDVKAESSIGQGTKFTITIPAEQRQLPLPVGARGGDSAAILNVDTFSAEIEFWSAITGEAQPLEGLQAAITVPPAKLPAGRVLIVDDNKDMRDYLTRIVRSRWKVRSAINGQEAIALVQTWVPDVIVSDVMMPELDGFGLLKALRENDLTREIPVMLLSARAGDEARLDGMGAGADDYLIKPFSSREFIARVESLMLRAQMRSLELQHARRMETVFAQAPVGIAILQGPRHTFELANPAYLELIGNRPLMGKQVREALPELEGQGIFELLDHVYQSALPYVARSLRLEVKRGIPEETQEAFFDFVYQPILDSRGKSEGIAVVVFEVTELSKARRSAEIANRAKDEFLAMLGHELRNPLAPIMTSLHLMRLRGIDTAEKERSIIERQARHLVRLVDDLLDVSRIAQGKIQLHKQYIETGTVIAKAIETASPLLEERAHILHVDVPVQGMPVDVDPERFTQVVSNLLTNAAKYTDKGGVVDISARRDGANIIIKVRDTGKGMTPDLLPHIFDMFVQDRQAIDRSKGGLGLGLAIVRSITNLHGGTVSAESAGLGHGSAFTVTIPAAQERRATPRFSELRKDSPLNSMHPYSILIVDDNEDAARTFGELLTMYGHTVRIAFDGPSALKTIEDFVPDLGFLDIGLPGMDGYELAKYLRRNTALRMTRLIAVSGYGLTVDRIRSIEAGFEMHLVKPMTKETLEAVLRAKAAGTTGAAAL
jgi:signal transduction histidine kinase